MDNLSPFSENSSPSAWLEPPETVSPCFNSPNTKENDTVVPETPPVSDGQICVHAVEAMFGVDFVPRITEEYTPYMIGGVPFKRRHRKSSERLRRSKEPTLKAESVDAILQDTVLGSIEPANDKPTVKTADVRFEKVSKKVFDMSKIDPFYHETLLRFVGDSVPNQDRLDIWACMFPVKS